MMRARSPSSVECIMLHCGTSSSTRRSSANADGRSTDCASGPCLVVDDEPDAASAVVTTVASTNAALAAIVRDRRVVVSTTASREVVGRAVEARVVAADGRSTENVHARGHLQMIFSFVVSQFRGFAPVRVCETRSKYR